MKILRNSVIVCGKKLMEKMAKVPIRTLTFHRTVRRHVWGVVGSLMTTLQQFCEKY